MTYVDLMAANTTATVGSMQQFCSTDEGRWIHKVHSLGGWLVATDGHSMVAKRGAGECDELDDGQAKVLGNLIKAPVTHICSLDRLRRWCVLTPWDCKECDGTGIITCTCERCDHEHDCVCQSCGGKAPTNPGRVCGLTVDRNRLLPLLAAFSDKSIRLGVHDGAILVLEGHETRGVLMYLNVNPPTDATLRVKKVSQ